MAAAGGGFYARWRARMADRPAAQRNSTCRPAANISEAVRPMGSLIVVPGEREVQRPVSSARGEYGDGRGVHSTGFEAAVGDFHTCRPAGALRCWRTPQRVLWCCLAFYSKKGGVMADEKAIVARGINCATP